LALASLAAPRYASAQTPDPQWGYCENRGNAYARDVQIDGCTAVIRSGRETPDKLALAFSRRGNAYAALKEYANAIADLDQAGQLAPNNSSYQNSRCWWRAVANRELEVARAACDAALKLAPGFASAFDSRGLVGLRQGRFMDAWDDYNAARDWDALEPSYLFGRGVAALGLGHSKQGKADIALATELDSKIAQTYASYGVTPVLRTPTLSAVQAVTTFRDCADCPEMVSIPAGSFMMGSPEGEAYRHTNEGPQRRVTVPAFAAGKYEVTWAEWDRCVAAGGCPMLPEWVTEERKQTTRPGVMGSTERLIGTDAAHPVTNITWEQAKAYANWLSEKTGRTYNLLSEAQWEYAARAGTTTPFSFGTTLRAFDANSPLYERSEGDRDTTPVGTFPANIFGLHDMHGNVWEMVQDCYEDDYSQGQPSDGSAYLDRRGGDFDQCSYGRVIRGGSVSGSEGPTRRTFGLKPRKYQTSKTHFERSASRSRIRFCDLVTLEECGLDRVSNGVDELEKGNGRGDVVGFRVARSRDLAASAPSASSLEAGTNPATTPAPERTSPEWARRPSAEDMARYYPERAQRLEQSGQATISCVVLATGDLSDCSIVSESPPDMGFGDATLRASRLFKMKPVTLLGQPVHGGRVRIPVTWTLP
jgi:TonB family protein